MNMFDRNKRVATWVGIKVLDISPAGEPEGSFWGEIDMTGFALYPEEVVCRILFNFPEDIKACFEYLVPAIFDKGYHLQIDASLDGGYRVRIMHYGGLYCEAKAINDNLAVALFEAVERLIKKG